MINCQTQWRVGIACAVGLDYNAVFRVAEALEIKVNAKMLSAIRLMESLSLEYWQKKGSGSV